MQSLIFATNNPHKMAEVKDMLPAQIAVISLKEAGMDIEIPEPHDTLEANASEKSGVIYKLTGQNCVSEDTGLEVDALDGAPGVKSARFAGENANPEANIQLLLRQLEGEDNRNARFRTVISLWWQGTEFLFEGVCPGHITHNKQGRDGFGYDPVFIPDGYTQSFAQMPSSLKNTISHRAIAFKKFITFMQRFL